MTGVLNPPMTTELSQKVEPLVDIYFQIQGWFRYKIDIGAAYEILCRVIERVGNEEESEQLIPDEFRRELCEYVKSMKLKGDTNECVICV